MAKTNSSDTPRDQRDLDNADFTERTKATGAFFLHLVAGQWHYAIDAAKSIKNPKRNAYGSYDHDD